MNTPRNKERNAPRRKPMLDVKRLFSAMAYDLGIQTDSDVTRAHDLLCAGKYLSFLNSLDAMTSQLYTSVGTLQYRQHQLAALLSKYPFKDPAIDREKVAIGKFKRSEHRCRRMNQKFRARRDKMEPAHMQYMREFIRGVIGDEPSLPYIYEHSDFGPGASLGSHGAQTDFLTKLDMLTVTPGIASVARVALMHNIHYWSYLSDGELVCYDANKTGFELQYVQYNKITCVPKNAKTDRTIAIEPALNGFVQKGIDLLLRQKLNRIGIDLSKQSLNRALARLGSLDRGYSTIDLSAASDSISIELVRELLPPSWFSLLNAARSPSYQYNGETARYEKFCSMGNGFCFPLETLLFTAASSYAMSVACLSPRKTFSVYGDDIIVPQECALLLLEVLRDIGFRHNEDKTFVFGGFRESCGADWFEGVNVRPVYVKEELALDHRVYPLLNELRRRNLLSAWQSVFDQLPGKFRNVRPYPRDDDSAIDVPLDVFMTSKKARWNRSLHTWEWDKLVVSSAKGRKPRTDCELLAGKLRGDLGHEAATFAARFSERTVVQVGI